MVLFALMSPEPRIDSSMMPRLSRISCVVTLPRSRARTMQAMAGIFIASNRACSTPSQIEERNLCRFSSPQKAKNRCMILTIVLHLHVCVPHGLIQAVVLKQFFMRSLIIYDAVADHIDSVRVHDGRESVRDDDQRLAFREF